MNDAVCNNPSAVTRPSRCGGGGPAQTRPYILGLQMMVGLPGDTPGHGTGHGPSDRRPCSQFVRITRPWCLGSQLALRHFRGQYTPLSLEAAVALVADLYQIFHRHDIAVARMGLQAGPELSPDADLVAGPFHPAFGEMVQSALWLDAISRHLEKEG
jgi:histone acetyltransferase (RNA polymerase elongator complex component)